jgi:hypothetical protein
LDIHLWTRRNGWVREDTLRDNVPVGLNPKKQEVQLTIAAPVSAMLDCECQVANDELQGMVIAALLMMMYQALGLEMNARFDAR